MCYWYDGTALCPSNEQRTHRIIIIFGVFFSFFLFSGAKRTRIRRRQLKRKLQAMKQEGKKEKKKEKEKKKHTQKNPITFVAS